MTDHTDSIVKPKRPNGPGWIQEDGSILPIANLGYPYEVWAHYANRLLVISAVEVANEPGQPEIGPEYHISVSAMGTRCSSVQAAWVLGQFDLTDAKEDNHVPSGNVRNFWRPVADNLSGYECKCVDEEPAIKEDKGDFIWRGVTK